MHVIYTHVANLTAVCVFNETIAIAVLLYSRLPPPAARLNTSSYRCSILYNFPQMTADLHQDQTLPAPVQSPLPYRLEAPPLTSWPVLQISTAATGFKLHHLEEHLVSLLMLLVEPPVHQAVTGVFLSKKDQLLQGFRTSGCLATQFVRKYP